MRKKLLTLLIGSLIVSPAMAQSERAEQLRRVVDGLNAADPVTRLITFEEAMATNDVNLRSIAIRTVAAGDDPVLLEAALTELLSSKKSYIVEIESSEEYDDRGVVESKLAGNLDVQFINFDKSSGEFSAYSEGFSFYRKENQGRNYDLRPGNFQGERLSFEVNTHFLRNDGISCKVKTTFNASTKLFEGAMNCSWNKVSMAITIDPFN